MTYSREHIGKCFDCQCVTLLVHHGDIPTEHGVVQWGMCASCAAKLERMLTTTEFPPHTFGT